MWYDVAIWIEQPPSFPKYVGYIQAASAFQAVENTMRFYGVSKAVYASSRALNGSIIYRCVKVALCGRELVTRAPINTETIMRPL